MQHWLGKYGEKYRPLVIAYNHLENSGLLQGNQSLSAIHEDDRERSARQTRMQLIHERRFQQIQQETSEHLDLILENLKAMV